MIGLRILTDGENRADPTTSFLTFPIAYSQRSSLNKSV